MKLLGSRLRQRRRKMKLRQRDVNPEGSASFLSKVENGVVYPSLNNLREWSQTLGTTSGDLMGDSLVLEAAKHSVLVPEKCHNYLNQLPSCFFTSFLRELTTSATSLSSPVPKPPREPEAEYLTAKVMVHRGMVQEAKELLQKTLSRPCSPLWRIHCLSLLCLIYDELAEATTKHQTSKLLRSTLLELSDSSIVQTLPEADTLTLDDVVLLRLSALVDMHSSPCLD